MQIFIPAQIYRYGAIAIKIDVYAIALFTTVMIYVSVVRTLARGPHAAHGRFLCGPRTPSVSRISHKVRKTLYYQDILSKSHVTEVQINMQRLGDNNIFLQFLTLQ